MKAAFTSYSGDVRAGAAKAVAAAPSRQTIAAVRTLPPPDELDVSAPAYLHDHARLVAVLELRVPPLEQVLPHQGDLEPRAQASRGAHVEAVVTLDGLVGQRAHVAVGRVELHAPRQVDAGLERDDVPGARALVGGDHVERV